MTLGASIHKTINNSFTVHSFLEKYQNSDMFINAHAQTKLTLLDNWWKDKAYARAAELQGDLLIFQPKDICHLLKNSQKPQYVHEQHLSHRRNW